MSSDAEGAQGGITSELRLGRFPHERLEVMLAGESVNVRRTVPVAETATVAVAAAPLPATAAVATAPPAADGAAAPTSVAAAAAAVAPALRGPNLDFMTLMP